jgi:hypothetical protein
MSKLFTLISLAALMSLACTADSSAVMERKIASSESLTHIDQVCMNFPKPASFELERKGLSGNLETNVIYYQYIAHAPFDSIKRFYQDLDLRDKYELLSENYKDPLMNEINFQYLNVRINIENQPPSWIVVIECNSPVEVGKLFSRLIRNNR